METPARAWTWCGLFALCVLLLAPLAGAASGLDSPGQSTPPPQGLPSATTPPPLQTLIEQVQNALVRLPLAAVLGAALALRPKRRGTPPRTPAVVETQVMLAVVGSLIIIVVGDNLARAFGIV